MGFFIKSDETPSAPLATNPYVEKDYAIVRDATLAMLDFSNEETWAGAGPITGGSTLGNLVAAGANGTLNSASGTLPAVVTGTITPNGAVSGGGNPHVNLPVEFNLGADVTRALLILHMKLPATGYSASDIRGIIGSGTAGGASLQWLLYIQADGSGDALNLVFRVRGSAGNIDCTLTGAALDAILDGDLHQIGLGFEIAGGAGQGKIYVDGALAQNGTAGAMTAFNQPGGTPTLLAAPSVNAIVLLTSLAARFGRPSIWDLTDRTDLSFADVLERDAQGADGFVS